MTAAAVTLAPMRWWHLAGVMELERELFAEETWSEAAFWNELAERDSRYYVVALDVASDTEERVLGYAGLSVFGDEGHVLTLGVTATAQGRGLGAALLDALLAEAAARRAVRVLLDVRADNEVAQRLYRGRGFVPIGLRRRYYQPSGTDAVVMARG
ncbi:MAG TPA: ribosomal protein S18-alanine N-acetyltransferase [Mycobacteriales bacterium]